MSGTKSYAGRGPKKYAGRYAAAMLTLCCAFSIGSMLSSCKAPAASRQPEIPPFSPVALSQLHPMVSDGVQGWFISNERMIWFLMRVQGMTNDEDQIEQ